MNVANDAVAKEFLHIDAVLELLNTILYSTGLQVTARTAEVPSDTTLCFGGLENAYLLTQP